jgi:protein PhnA
MENQNLCPKCQSPYVYELEGNYICPECAHEWPINSQQETQQEFTVLDSNGNKIDEGDFVTLIKDLKVKGSSINLKMGTKAKIARLVEDGDHNIDCRIDGFGSMLLKSEFVKKINKK